MTTDPVCGAKIDEATAPKHDARFSGVTFYFCSPKCQVAFQQEPEKYVEVESEDDDLVYDARMFLGDM